MKGQSKKVLEQPIAYIIKDPAFQDFSVLNSPNAWWTIREKVELFIVACKLDATVEECCAYAGISQAQYRYFYEQHPDFSQVKAACNELMNLTARNRLATGITESFDNALRYLERKKKKEFSTRTETDITSGGEKLETFDDERIAKIAKEIINREKEKNSLE